MHALATPLVPWDHVSTGYLLLKVDHIAGTTPTAFASVLLGSARSTSSALRTSRDVAKRFVPLAKYCWTGRPVNKKHDDKPAGSAQKTARLGAKPSARAPRPGAQDSARLDA